MHPLPSAGSLGRLNISKFVKSLRCTYCSANYQTKGGARLKKHESYCKSRMSAMSQEIDLHNLTLVQSSRGLLVTLAHSLLMSLSRALVSLEILFPIRLRLFTECRRRFICFFIALSHIVMFKILLAGLPALIWLTFALLSCSLIAVSMLRLVIVSNLVMRPSLSHRLQLLRNLLNLVFRSIRSSRVISLVMYLTLSFGALFPC